MYLPIVVSLNFSSAISLAKLAPINTETSIFNFLLIILEIRSIPPPSATSNPFKIYKLYSKGFNKFLILLDNTLINDSPTAVDFINPWRLEHILGMN